MGPFLGDGLVTAILWLSVPAVPLLVASLRVFPRLRKAVPLLAPAAVLPALAVAMTEPSPARLPWLLLGAELGLDAVGRTFLILTALLWCTAALFSRGYLARDAQRDRFMTYFLLTMAGNLWLVVARDPATFYTAFALMTFAAYGLVVHRRTPEAVRAGRIYIMMAVLGEVCIATGLWLLVSSGTDVGSAAALQDRSAAMFVLLLAGFGIKAGALPLHVWLPLAHPVAPTPASAVLSGAMIKAGLLGWLRFLPSPGPEAVGAMIAVGVAGALGGVVFGLTQRDPKTILAYSSVSQMGWMIVAVAALVAAPSQRGVAAAAIALYALHHGLVKGGLFLSTGLSGPPGGTGPRVRRAGQVALALTMAAAPATGGAAAKGAIKGLVPFLPGSWPHILPWLLAAAAAGTALLMIHFLAAAWPDREGASTSDSSQWGAWLSLVLAASVLPLAAAGGAPWPGPDLPGSLAPLLAGVLVTLAVRRFFRGGGKTVAAMPAGDLLVPLEAFTRRLHSIWERNVGPTLRRWHGTIYSFRWHEPHEVRALRKVLDLGEAWWGRWPVCGVLFLLSLIATAMLLLPGAAFPVP